MTASKAGVYQIKSVVLHIYCMGFATLKTGIAGHSLLLPPWCVSCGWSCLYDMMADNFLSLNNISNNSTKAHLSHKKEMH